MKIKEKNAACTWKTQPRVKAFNDFAHHINKAVVDFITEAFLKQLYVEIGRRNREDKTNRKLEEGSTFFPTPRIEKVKDLRINWDNALIVLTSPCMMERRRWHNIAFSHRFLAWEHILSFARSSMMDTSTTCRSSPFIRSLRTYVHGKTTGFLEELPNDAKFT